MRSLRFGLVFMGLGCLLTGIAVLEGSLAWVLAWPALNFFIVGAAYCLSLPIIFGKKATGELPGWAYVVFLPYISLYLGIWHLIRLVSKEDAHNQVTPRLYVGRRLLTSEMPPGWDIIIDLTTEFMEPKGVRLHPGYRNIALLDGSAPKPEALRAMIQAVPAGVVYVHCAQGHGRTGLFAAALLLHWREVETPEQAVELLKSRRAGIALNSGQMACLRAFHAMAIRA